MDCICNRSGETPVCEQCTHSHLGHENIGTCGESCPHLPACDNQTYCMPITPK